MVGITRHLHALGVALGVDYRFGHRALRIEHDGARHRRLCEDTDGHTHTFAADTVISNADIWPTFRTLLPDLNAPENILRQERSTSGVIFYWGAHRAAGLAPQHPIQPGSQGIRTIQRKAIRATTQRCTSTSAQAQAR